jgi:large subunit ribosomal protein L29
MKLTELRDKTIQELRQQVSDFRRQAFKLKLLKSNAEFKQSHEIAKVRRQIAQTLTLLAQKTGQTS